MTAGTIFHDSLFATYMIAESKKGISANQLKRTLAVSWHTKASCRTAILGASSHSDAAGTPGAEGFDLAFWVGWYTMYHRTVRHSGLGDT